MEYSHLSASVLDTIGNTPLVDLARITRGLRGRIFAKLEYFNPGYSKKDRIALQMIEDAESCGQLQPGDSVVELTSGNTGTGLAIVCAAKGYHFVAVMSRGNSSERARMMTALGAEVVLVDQCPESTPGQVSGADLARVEARTQAIVAERGAFRADQFQSDGNRRAHYRHTAPEIMRQSGGIDAFCDFVGSGGSFAGCAQYFKECDPSIACFLSSRPARPSTRAIRLRMPTTRSRVAVMPGMICRRLTTRSSTAPCKSTMKTP